MAAGDASGEVACALFRQNPMEDWVEREAVDGAALEAEAVQAAGANSPQEARVGAAAGAAQAAAVAQVAGANIRLAAPAGEVAAAAPAAGCIPQEAPEEVAAQAAAVVPGAGANTRPAAPAEEVAWAALVAVCTHQEALEEVAAGWVVRGLLAASAAGSAPTPGAL